MKPAEWIDRYVAALGAAHPARKASDAELEVRSLICDELEAAGFPDPETADEATVLRVLDGFGDPRRLAAASRPERYLIGPSLFPIFRTVTTVVLAVIVGLWLFGMAVAAGTGNDGAPLELIGGLFTGVAQTFATLVVVFALAERFSPERPVAAARSWNARSLPPVRVPDRVKTFDTMASIGAAVAGIMVLNWHPQGIQGIYFAGGDGITAQPLFSETFLGFVPWLTALWVLEIALGVTVLAMGHWRPLTRTMEFALSLAGLGILANMIATSGLAATTSFEPVLKLALALAFAVVGVRTMTRLYRLIVRRRMTSSPA